LKLLLSDKSIVCILIKGLAVFTATIMPSFLSGL